MGNADRGVIAMLLALVGIVGAGAWGQEDAPLGGPKVKARSVPGVRGEYVPGGAERMGARGRSVPMAVYLGAIRGLSSGDARDADRLTAAQGRALRAEIERFGADVRAYLGAVRPEVEALVADLPAAERRRVERELAGIERLARTIDTRLGTASAGRERAGMREERSVAARRVRETADAFRLRYRDHAPPPMEGEDEAMRAMTEMGDTDASRGMAMSRLREIRESAPSETELQTRLWLVLSEAQRSRVEEELLAYQAEAQRRFEEQRLERRLAQQRQDAPAPRETDRAPAVDLDEATIRRIVRAVRAGEQPERLWARLPEQVRRRLEALEPEARARAVERLLRARRDGGESPQG